MSHLACIVKAKMIGGAAPIVLIDCRQKRKRKEKTTPFGVNLMRSQVLYRAALLPLVSPLTLSDNVLSNTRSVSCELLGGVHDLAHFQQEMKRLTAGRVTKVRTIIKNMRVQSVHPFCIPFACTLCSLCSSLCKGCVRGQ